MIEPELGLKIVICGGWILVTLGILKMVIWVIGELAPNCYRNMKSEGLRRFFTGTGNRLVFGLGGLITVILGGVFIGLGFLFLHLFGLT